MNPNSFIATLNDIVQDNLSEVHTMLPAKITSVDYGSGRASVLPLVKTQIGINKTISYPELSNVPLVIMSGNSGKSRLTFPVQAGDTVIVLFSERDPSNFLSSSGTDVTTPIQSSFLGLYPIGILPCISTSGNSKSMSNQDVDLENDISKVKLTPTGTLKLSNDIGFILMEESGTVTVSDGTAVVKLSGGSLNVSGATALNYSGGPVNINGLIISADGKLTDSSGLSFTNHKHQGVQSGDAISGKPIN